MKKLRANSKKLKTKERVRSLLFSLSSLALGS